MSLRWKYRIQIYWKQLIRRPNSILSYLIRRFLQRFAHRYIASLCYIKKKKKTASASHVYNMYLRSIISRYANVMSIDVFILGNNLRNIIHGPHYVTQNLKIRNFSILITHLLKDFYLFSINFANESK